MHVEILSLVVNISEKKRTGWLQLDVSISMLGSSSEDTVEHYC